MSDRQSTINKIIFLILFTAVFTVPTFAQTKSNNSHHHQPTETNSPKPTSILQAIISLFKSPENRLITRGNEVCPISPGNLGEQIIWSDRPLFIWQGKISQSQINLYSSSVNFNYEQDEQLIWSESVPSNSQAIAYDGKPLQSGFVYDWEFISNGKTYRPTFVVMAQPQRKAIATELITLEKQLQTKNKTPETIAIAKAEYFLQQQLWSDALQQLYSVTDPSPELGTKINEIERYLCR